MSGFRNLLIILCFSPLLAIGKTEYSESIPQLDSLLNRSISLYQAKQLDEALEQSFNLLHLAEQQNNVLFQIKALRLQALVHETQLEYSKAFANYESALLLTREKELFEEEIKTLKKLNQLFGLQQNYPGGLPYAFTALRIADSIGNKRLSIDMHVLISNSLIRQKELEKAEKYLSQATAVNEELKDDQKASEIAWTYGSLYNGLKDYDAAVNSLSSAISYHEKQGNISSLISTYSNIGQTLTKKGDLASLQRADSYLKKSLRLAKQEEDLENIIRNSISLAENEIAGKNFNEALALLEIATKENVQLKNLNFDFYIKKAETTAHEKLGNEQEALGAFKAFKTIQDSLYNVERTRLVTQIESQYSYEEEVREKQLAQLKFQKHKNINNILAVIAIALLLTAISMFYYFRLRRRNEKLLTERRQLLQVQKINELENDAEIRAINAMLDGREKERQAIADTLHDSVSTLLSSANMHLQAFKQNDNSNLVSIDKTQNIITEAAEKVRFLSHELMSSVLAKFGLDSAVNDLVEKLTTQNLEFTATTRNLEKRLPRELENKIYHIVEELCNNTIKHSKATEAQIELHREMDTLYISVRDNGIGFIETVANEKTGMGLNQIRARVKGMSGYMNIQSEPKQFCLINISVPIVEAPS